MDNNNRNPQDADEPGAYREYARKMGLFENGPTTTHFDQLTAAGVSLPEPDAVADDAIRTKLWQVLAGLAKLRAYLDLTDHLNDRDLYAHLWHYTLREEVPAIDELGFDHMIDLVCCGADEETQLYLKYYADDIFREDFSKNWPDDPMPAQAEPPYQRDVLLPAVGLTAKVY